MLTALWIPLPPDSVWCPWRGFRTRQIHSKSHETWKASTECWIGAQLALRLWNKTAVPSATNVSISDWKTRSLSQNWPRREHKTRRSFILPHLSTLTTNGPCLATQCEELLCQWRQATDLNIYSTIDLRQLRELYYDLTTVLIHTSHQMAELAKSRDRIACLVGQPAPDRGDLCICGGANKTEGSPAPHEVWCCWRYYELLLPGMSCIQPSLQPFVNLFTLQPVDSTVVQLNLADITRSSSVVSLSVYIHFQHCSHRFSNHSVDNPMASIMLAHSFPWTTYTLVYHLLSQTCLIPCHHSAIFNFFWIKWKVYSDLNYSIWWNGLCVGLSNYNYIIFFYPNVM